MKHLRPLNLLMFALTQGVGCWYLFRGKEAIPFLSIALLLFSINCLMAAGYLINNYYDRAIDVRNKPHKALPDTPEAKKKALIVYVILNVLGLGTAVPPALAAGIPSLIFIQVGMVLSLWAYSKWWKGMPVIGNVAVALLTSLSIVIFYWYYPQLWEGPHVLSIPYNPVLFVFAGFAFVLTWMREMVKDIEDMEGDRAEGCRTLPIVWNTKGVTGFVSFLNVCVIFVLSYFCWRLLAPGEKIASIGMLLLLVLPLIIWMVRLYKAKTSKEFGRLSNALKLIMLGGLVCLLLI